MAGSYEIIKIPNRPTDYTNQVTIGAYREIRG